MVVYSKNKKLSAKTKQGLSCSLVGVTGSRQDSTRRRAGDGEHRATQQLAITDGLVGWACGGRLLGL